MGISLAGSLTPTAYPDVRTVQRIARPVSRRRAGRRPCRPAFPSSKSIQQQAEGIPGPEFHRAGLVMQVEAVAYYALMRGTIMIDPLAPASPAHSLDSQPQ